MRQASTGDFTVIIKRSKIFKKYTFNGLYKSTIKDIIIVKADAVVANLCNIFGSQLSTILVAIMSQLFMG